MRPTAYIVLLAILLAAVSPFAVLAVPAATADGPSLGTLDVCSKAAPAVSPAGAMPCLASCTFVSVPLLAAATVAIFPHSFTELLLSSSNDQPPRS